MTPGEMMVAQVDLAYAGFGVGRYVRRLASYAMFEGRPLTTRGRWFNPLVFAWLRTLAALPGEPEVRAPIFVTGLGRSGTTILGVLLSLNAEAGFLNEPKAIWHVIDPRQDINGNYSSSGGIYRLGAGDVDAVIRSRARRVFARYLSATGSRRLVDKYPELIFRVEYVKAIFPDARFIFITRSGRDAVPSVVKWSERLGVISRDAVDDWWGRNDSKWHCLRTQVIQADPSYGKVAALARADLDHANRAALEWIVTMREGLDQQRRNPDHLIRIAYEDLLRRPETELVRLQESCGLEPDPAVVTYAKGRLYDNPAKDWPDLLPGIDDLFQETMSMLGYEAR